MFAILVDSILIAQQVVPFTKRMKMLLKIHSKNMQAIIIACRFETGFD